MSLRKALASVGIFLSFYRPYARTVISRLQPYSTEYSLIRVGTQRGDGGYLIPDCMVGLTRAFSAGIADNCDFETDLVDNYNLKVHMLDPTVPGPPVQRELFEFQSKYLSDETEDDFVTLDDWVKQCAPPEGDLLLSMDIESSEFACIGAASRRTLDRFRIIVMEIHSLEEVGSLAGLERLDRLLARLLKNHTVVHLHANNTGGLWKFPGLSVPAGVEVTLLRNDFVSKRSKASIPHELDRPCDASKVEVNKNWFPIAH